MFLFYGASCRHGRGAALDGTAIHPHILDGTKVKFDAGVTFTVLVHSGLFDRKQGNLCHSGLYRSKLTKYYTLQLCKYFRTLRRTHHCCV